MKLPAPLIHTLRTFPRLQFLSPHLLTPAECHTIGLILGDGSVGTGLCRLARTAPFYAGFDKSSFYISFGNRDEINPWMISLCQLNYLRHRSFGFIDDTLLIEILPSTIRAFMEYGIVVERKPGLVFQKQLPLSFLESISWECKLALLAGLLDSDGAIRSHSSGKSLSNGYIAVCSKVGDQMLPGIIRLVQQIELDSNLRFVCLRGTEWNNSIEKDFQNRKEYFTEIGMQMRIDNKIYKDYVRNSSQYPDSNSHCRINFNKLCNLPVLYQVSQYMVVQKKKDTISQVTLRTMGSEK